MFGAGPAGLDQAMAVSMNKRTLTFLYLIVGILLLFIYLVLQPNVYNGYFRGMITIEASDQYEFLQVYTNTIPKWSWTKPRNYKYTHADLDILEEENKTASFDLLEGTWNCGSETGSLNPESVSRLIFPKIEITTLGSDYRAQIEAVIDIFHALRDGTIPGPRHHTYFVESPIRMSYHHCTGHRNYGHYAIWFWLGIWPLTFFVVKTKTRIGRFNHITVYLLTLAIMVFFDAILILIGMSSPPGPIEEFREFFLALLNLPAWIIIGDKLLFSSWTNYLLGALGWATIVSIIILLMIDAEQRYQD